MGGDELEIRTRGLTAVIEMLTELDTTLARVERLLTEDANGEENSDA